MQVKKQQLEQNMDQRTGSKLGKECDKAVYCHPAYLTSMQNTSCEMPGWMKHKLESRLPGEISITSDMHMILKTLLMKVKEQSEKAGFKLNIQKMKIMTSGPINSFQFSCSVMSDSSAPSTAAHPAFLSITNAWILLKLVSI